MFGAIVGDVIGSVYEHNPTKSVALPLLQPRSRFTDDTVLTVATAWAILRDRPFDVAYREFGRRYPRAGYGGGFIAWLRAEEPAPYNSYGNGSAMRMSPAGFAYDTAADVLRNAQQSASVTHDHPEGIKGAQAVALAILMAREGKGKDHIREAIASRFGHDLDRTIDGIRPNYRFDVSCQGSVPEAVVVFLEADGVEHAVVLRSRWAATATRRPRSPARSHTRTIARFRRGSCATFAIVFRTSSTTSSTHSRSGTFDAAHRRRTRGRRHRQGKTDIHVGARIPRGYCVGIVPLGVIRSTASGST